MEYLDLIYSIAQHLPHSEEFNLKSQITRAATSIQLNIAEGSTSQTDAEQARFVGLAIRSLVETVACQRQINRRSYLTDPGKLRESCQFSEKLFSKLQAFRNALLSGSNSRAHEEPEPYEPTLPPPF